MSVVLLYDSDCGLCNRVVNFMLDHDPHDIFRYAALQSPFGKAQLEALGLPVDSLDTFVLIEEGKAEIRSRAAFRVLHLLGYPWRALAGLRALPRALTDAAYDFIAKNRIRCFGRTDARCRMMTPVLRKKFLD